MAIKKYILIALGCLMALGSFAQDPTFSQFYSSTAFTNPGMAADGQDPSLTIANRSNTNDKFKEYRLTQVTANYQFKIKASVYGSRNKYDNNSGTSLTFFQENTGAGSYNTTGALATFAHSLQLAKAHYFALGMQLGYGQRKLKGDLNWGSEYEPGVGFNDGLGGYLEDENASKGYMMMNAGLMWNYNSSRLKAYMRKHSFDAFAGIAIYNLNKPNVSITDNKSKLPINFKFTGGLKFAPHPQVSIYPDFLYMRQNGNNHLNIGTYSMIKGKSSAYAKKAKFMAIAGIWYRLNDAVVPLVGVGMYDFKLMVTYDINASQVKYQSRGRGATEVTLKYSIQQNAKNYTRGVLYPSF